MGDSLNNKSLIIFSTFQSENKIKFLFINNYYININGEKKHENINHDVFTVMYMCVCVWVFDERIEKKYRIFD